MAKLQNKTHAKKSFGKICEEVQVSCRTIRFVSDLKLCILE